MAGVLPIETAMLEKLKVLGYAEVAWLGGSLWGSAGQVARGHEFHYSEITAESQPGGWLAAGLHGSPPFGPSPPVAVSAEIASWPVTFTCTGPLGRRRSHHFLCCCQERS